VALVCSDGIFKYKEDKENLWSLKSRNIYANQ